MTSKDARAGRGGSIGGALWQLARPRTCLVGVLAYTFGVEITGGSWTATTVLGLFAMFLVPVVANLHNSYTDLAEDARNLPGRLRLVEAAGVRRIRLIVYVGLGVIVCICATMGWAPLLVGVIGALLLVSYSAPPVRAKARPVAGLIVFSMVVSVPFLIGSIVSVDWWAPRSPFNGIVAVWWVFVSCLFLAKGCVKNVPDYVGDSEAGIRTSATIMSGSRAAAVVAVAATWLVYLLFPLLVWATHAPQRLYLAVPWMLLAMWHVTRLLRGEDPSFLNSVLKWDMCITVVFLAHLAVLPRLSLPALGATLACLSVLLLTDLVGADSRSQKHLPNKSDQPGRISQ